MYYDCEDFHIYVAKQLPAVFCYTKFRDLPIVYMSCRFTKEISFICTDNIVHLE